MPAIIAPSLPVTPAQADAGAAPTPEPIAGFSRCHAGILQHLEALDGLPALVEPAARARSIAGETLAFFRAAVFEHHQEEERELFPAVIASSAPGEERARVQAIAAQLTREHREVEAAYEALEPALKRLAKGHDAALPAGELAAQVHSLVERYEDHARYEENEFLPLAERILGRNGNHLAALGLALHLRHALPGVLQRYGSRI